MLNGRVRIDTTPRSFYLSADFLKEIEDGEVEFASSDSEVVVFSDSFGTRAEYRIGQYSALEDAFSMRLIE